MGEVRHEYIPYIQVEIFLSENYSYIKIDLQLKCVLLYFIVFVKFLAAGDLELLEF